MNHRLSGLNETLKPCFQTPGKTNGTPKSCGMILARWKTRSKGYLLFRERKGERARVRKTERERELSQESC